jgi:uncharacterized protein (UPF0332 family)
MSLAELKKSGRIREIQVDRKQIGSLMAVARRDLGVAEGLAGRNFDWCYMAAYNSMLQASRALMCSYGYSAGEEAHHKTVVEFVAAVLGEKDAGVANTLDRMRRKRHDVTYDEAGIISEYEAKHALETARSYLAMIEKRIRKRE